MNRNLKIQTQIIIALIAVYVLFYGFGRYRQGMGNRYFHLGTQSLQEGNYVQAVNQLKKAINLSPRSYWLDQAKNEIAFSQILLGQASEEQQPENTSLFDWLTSSAVLSIAGIIIILLIMGGLVHFNRLAKINKLEEYVAYLKTVEHRIKAKIKPSIEGLNTTTYDGVGDYENYINYYKKSEYVLLANCLMAEYFLSLYPEAQDRAATAEKCYVEFISNFGDSNYREEIQQKLGNLYFFNLRTYDKAKESYSSIVEKYPQSKWVKIAQARIKLIEENPDDNYEPLQFYVKAERLYEDKKYEDSLEQFAKLITAFGQNKLAIESQYNIAEIYMYKTNQTERAIQEYQKLIATYSQSQFAGKSMYKIGECYKKLQKFGEAINAYEKFIANYPQAEFLDYAYYYIGLCCEQLKDVKKALETYQKIVRDFPDSIWVVVAESRITALTPK